jgi:hypothetical protein
LGRHSDWTGRFYQKITDIYATALDYNPDAETTQSFFAAVQNKLHFAIHGRTAAEIIMERADSAQERMGLASWKNAPHGKILKPDLSGGWQSLVSARRAGVFLKSDERILGDSDFVETVIDAVEEHIEKKSVYKRDGVDLEQAAQRTADLLHVSVEEIWLHRKKPNAVQARSLFCFWATRELGVSATAVAKRLGLSLSAVSRAAQRGERLMEENRWELK